MRHQHNPNVSSHQSELYSRSLGSRWRRLKRLALVAMAFVTVSAYALQDSPALQAVTRGHSSAPVAPKHQEAAQSSQGLDIEQYKPLMEELGHLQQKLVDGVQFPAPRTQSRLLPMAPPSSSFFVALPNYGEALHQAYQIFQQELQESSVLNDFWKNKVGMAAPIVDEAINKTYQFLQFFGDEIVVTGSVNAKSGSVLVIAEARKPGLKAFVQQLLDQYAGKTKPPVRIYTPQQLALVKTQPAYKPLLILVRPDFVIASSDLATLRSFNAQLNRGGAKFTSNPFGEKLAQQYQNGAAVVFGADLHQFLNLRPRGNQKDEALLNQSGFADLKYLVGEGQVAGGVASSNLEISFAGPRKGIASWLGGPAPLTGLDFVSRDAAYAVALNLKNFGQVFDDIRNFASSTNPGADEGIAQLESQLKISLKEDLFSKLSGQIAIALDGPIMPTPAWKVVAQLVDANGLERTLKQLIAFANAQQHDAFTVKQETEDGVDFYTFQFPGSPKPMEVECAFVDGFLVAGPSHRIVKDAIRLRQNGNSLAKASEFQDLLPRDQGNGASGIIYQNLGKVLAAMGGAVPPDQAQLFEMLSKYGKPSATTLYGSENAIRMASRSSGFDPSAALVMAAITIPNLMRSKMAANESAAASTVRMLISAEGMYQNTYADRGYAPDLATLGPGKTAHCDVASESHACAIDATLGCSGRWCVNYGFRFHITGKCSGQLCDDYVIVATPIDSNQAGKSYCSTSDGVVRSQRGAFLSAPISISECQAWEPL